MHCSYYYDAETNLYYLQSRYYDPQVGRFINADTLVSTGQGLLGNNMFAYCGNNPINFSDSSGQFPGWVGLVIMITAVICLEACSAPAGAPEDYVQSNSLAQNCYGYAFGIHGNKNPGQYSGKTDYMYKEKNMYTTEEIAEYVMEDMEALGKDVRIVASPSDKAENEYIVAMKTSNMLNPSGIADYHFAVLLSDGTWADKPGGSWSRWNAINGTALCWDTLLQTGYYNSDTVYFAVGG